jgi:hypothetical protein
MQALHSNQSAMSLTERLFLVFAGVSFFLEDPVGKPFHEFDPPTEIIGEIFFRTLSTSLKVPGGTISPFEIFSYLLLLKMLLKHRFSVNSNLRNTHAFWFAVSIAFLMPLSALISVLNGYLWGGANTSFAIFQARTYPLLGAWIYIGFETSRNKELLYSFFKVMCSGLVFKSLLGIYCYLGVFGGDIADREYLLEHITSDFYSTAWVFLVTSIIFVRGSLWSQMARLGTAGIMILP